MEITVYEYNKKELIGNVQGYDIRAIPKFLNGANFTTKWIRLSANKGIPCAHTICSCKDPQFKKRRLISRQIKVCEEFGHTEKVCSCKDPQFKKIRFNSRPIYVCEEYGHVEKVCFCGSEKFKDNVCEKCGDIKEGFQSLDVLMGQFEKALTKPKEFPFDFKLAKNEVDKYKSIDVTNDSVILSLNYPFYNSNKSEDECKVETYCIKVIFTKNYLVTISEKYLKQFDRVSQRITTAGMSKEKIIHPDYLAYAIVKALIDNYFFVVDKIGQDIHSINDLLSPKNEGKLKNMKEPAILNRIQQIRIDMMSLRASIYPLKTMFSELLDTESDLVRDETRGYFGDLQKHLFQLMDMVAMARDHVNSSMELVLTRTTTQMDKVMKVLTILASIFLPLTFITGLYGMNFFPQPTVDNTPADFAGVYPDPYFLGVMGIMLIMSIGMLIIFKNRKYL